MLMIFLFLYSVHRIRSTCASWRLTLHTKIFHNTFQPAMISSTTREFKEAMSLFIGKFPHVFASLFKFSSFTGYVINPLCLLDTNLILGWFIVKWSKRSLVYTHVFFKLKKNKGHVYSIFGMALANCKYIFSSLTSLFSSCIIFMEKVNKSGSLFHFSTDALDWLISSFDLIYFSTLPTKKYKIDGEKNKRKSWTRSFFLFHEKSQQFSGRQ